MLIRGDYFKDILDQPRALEATLRELRLASTDHALAGITAKFMRGDFDRVILTGMGSSYHALQPMYLKLMSLGIAPLLMETSELIHFAEALLQPKTLIVAVSQSGRSAETVRLLELNRGRAPIIGVTNTDESPLAGEANAVVFTRAGAEFSVSCKTYVSSLMALTDLTDRLIGARHGKTLDELERAIADVALYLEMATRHIEEQTLLLKGVRSLFLVGRGSSMAAAGTGALTIKESDHFHAEGMTSAAFRHGPLEMLGQEIAVVVFGGPSQVRVLNQKLFEEIKASGSKAALCSSNSLQPAFQIADRAEAVTPILEILPIQMITLTLSALQGREAGRFDRASKVTTRE